MMVCSQANLRVRLREDTHLSHVDLDEVVSGFDLTTPDGFENFLQMQVMALGAIAPFATGAATFLALTDLRERAASDLHMLEKVPLTPTSNVSGPFHPLAIDYVLAGSRLGSQVLKKRWLLASDPHIGRANAYFTAPNHIELWKSFCVTCGGMSASGHLADQIVDDAERIFAIYKSSAQCPQLVKRTVYASTSP